MKRKDFVKGLAGMGIMATGISGCNSDTSQFDGQGLRDNKYKWKMVTTWPPNFPILGESCQLLAQWVEEMSAGQLTIHVYGGGELVPPLEAFEAVSIGGIELASSASYYWAGKIPAAQFFAAVPFGFNAQQMNTWLDVGGGMELWRELYAPYNLIPFNGGNTGLQMGGWYNRQINSLDDFNGLKMRIPGLGGKVLSKVGGSPILSPGSEIYTNLERGVIDATEWLGPYHDYLMGFPDIAKYYYYPGWHECGTTLEIIINKKKFESLPHHLRAILTSAISRVKSHMLAQFELKNSEYLAKIKSEKKVELKAFSTEILRKLKQTTTTTLEELAQKDNDTAKVYQSFKNFSQHQAEWSKASEAAYYSMSNL